MNLVDVQERAENNYDARAFKMRLTFIGISVRKNQGKKKRHTNGTHPPTHPLTHCQVKKTVSDLDVPIYEKR